MTEPRYPIFLSVNKNEREEADKLIENKKVNSLVDIFRRGLEIFRKKS